MNNAHELTEVLTKGPRHEVARSTIEELRSRLAVELAPVASEVGRGGALVVTLPLVCHAQAKPGIPRLGGAFAWSPFFVRRSLGGAIVDECLRSGHRSPAEVAVAVLEDAVTAWRRTGERRFHWEPWVAGLAPGARANVLADAVTWATALWSSFEWAAFPERPLVGGPAEQWTTPRARGVRLTTRTDLKVHLPCSSGRRDRSRPLAVVSVLNGTPPPPGTAALAYPALVTALCAPWRGAPSRSVGLWPDAGHAEWIDVDDAALEAATDLVVGMAVRWSRMRSTGLTGPDETSAVPAPRAAAG